MPEIQSQRRIQFAPDTRPSQMSTLNQSNTSNLHPPAFTASSTAMNTAAETAYLHNDITLVQHTKLNQFQNYCKAQIKKAHLHQFTENKSWSDHEDSKLAQTLKAAIETNQALADIPVKKLHKTIDSAIQSIHPDYWQGSQGSYFKAHKHLQASDSKRNGDYSILKATNGLMFTLLTHINQHESNALFKSHGIRITAGKIKIGQGGHGVVKIARSFTNPNELFAVKKIKNINDGKAEIAVTQQIQAAHGLIKPLAYAHIISPAKQATYIIYPLYENAHGGHEMAKIQKCRTDDPAAAKAMLKKTLVHYLETLANLHQQDIAHRDVKLPNFLHSNIHGIGLNDFGLAKRESEITDCTGTPGYLPPERGTDKYTGYGHDIFSLGRVGLELKWGTYKLSDIRQTHLKIQGRPIALQFDKDGNCEGIDLRKEFPQGLTYDALDEVLAGLLAKEPKERLTAEDALNCLFLRATATEFGSEHLYKNALEFQE